jgi:hypothetical protein
VGKVAALADAFVGDLVTGICQRRQNGRYGLASMDTPEDWLDRFVQAEEQSLQAGHDRRSFFLEHRGGMQREIDHAGWDPSWPVPTEHDIDDLVEHDWVRLDSSPVNKRRAFSLTIDGRLRAQRRRRDRSGLQRLPVSLDWTVLEPALDAAIESYEQAGAPDGGIAAGAIVLPPTTPRAAICELTRAGLLIDCEVEAGGTSGTDQIEGPGFVRPSLDALRLRRGWPRGAADAAIEGLVSALLAQADATDDPDESTRLRRTADWLGRVGTGILTGVGTSVATGGAHHLF